MKILLGMVASIALSVVAYIWAPYFLIGIVPVAAYFLWRGLDENEKEIEATHNKIAETDAQLRQQLLETHLNLIAVAGGNDKLKEDVLGLLIEAGRHLGDPHVDDGIIYELSYFLKWNQAGLDLVAQAKALIPAKPETN